MSFKENLIKTRSHLVFFFSLLVASGLVYLLETLQPPAAAETYRSQPPPPIARLTSQDLGDARVAWRYFDLNTQPETGLANSVDGYPASSMWDSGSTLLALMAARELGVIDDTAFHQRMARGLRSLARLPLGAQGLPNKSYNTQSLTLVDYNNQPAPQGIGWSALDLGRLLAALHRVLRRYPEHAPIADQILDRFHLENAVRNGELCGASGPNGSAYQEGRLGYEQYAARGFLLFGYDAVQAARWDRWGGTAVVLSQPVPIDRRDPREYGAQNFVLSEPYLMLGLEYGLSGEALEAARTLLAVQEARSEKEGILTAASETNLDEPPYFSYFCVYNGGKTWVCANHDGEIPAQHRVFSTSAAFGWYALFPDRAYARQIWEAARKLSQPDKGFYAGRYESDSRPNATFTANGNGLILESLLYRERGPLLRPSGPPPG